ncbi:hypothetical protein J7K55_05075 [Candidatus Aerophobetes bacterium]|nr:hypothetical protein [Candidatus Aerophobetes bacterium]
MKDSESKIQEPEEIMKDIELKREIEEKNVIQILLKFICIIATEFYIGRVPMVCRIRVKFSF